MAGISRRRLPPVPQGLVMTGSSGAEDGRAFILIAERGGFRAAGEQRASRAYLINHRRGRDRRGRGVKVWNDTGSTHGMAYLTARKATSSTSASTS